MPVTLFLRFTLCVALGIAVTVGVTWRSVWTERVGQDTARLLETWPEAYSYGTPRSTWWVVFRVPHDVDAARTPTWVRLHRVVPNGPDTEPDPYAFMCRGTGWPFLALAADYAKPYNPGPWMQTSGIRTPSLIPYTGFESSVPVTLPTRPIWSGFLANSAIYALVAWFPLGLPGFARRTWRRRRGLCVRCAYPVTGTKRPGTKCPECGTSVG